MGKSVVIHRFLPWVTSGGWRGVAVLTVLAVQIAVPFVALVASEPPTRGGFQMYSGLGGHKAEVVSASGETIEVDLETVTAEFRPELDWSSRLPMYLCEKYDDAVHIKMTRVTIPEPREWSVRCGE